MSMWDTKADHIVDLKKEAADAEDQWQRSRTYSEATMWREKLQSLYNEIDIANKEVLIRESSDS